MYICDPSYFSLTFSVRAVFSHVSSTSKSSPASLSSLFLQTPQIIIVVVVSEWPVFMLNADIAVHLYLSVSTSFKSEFFVTVSL